MIILGLTGSMGMGKTTVARMLRLVYHLPVWDADSVVRELLATETDLIHKISNLYPEVMDQGHLNRHRLKVKAFENDVCLNTLENLIHPILLLKLKAFLSEMQRLKAPLCVLEVPLLFEVGWHTMCTYTVLIYAPSFIQKERLLKRSGLDEKKIDNLLKRHWPLEQKKTLATFEIHTDTSKRETFLQVAHIIEEITTKEKISCAKLF